MNREFYIHSSAVRKEAGSALRRSSQSSALGGSSNQVALAMHRALGNYALQRLAKNLLQRQAMLQSPVRLQRLGANAGCSVAERRTLRQAIFNARGWLNKAIPQLEVTPLSARVIGSLRRNFGPTYGVSANASLIVGRLRRAYSELSNIPISCAGVAEAICAAGHCGFANAGSHEATICSNSTLAAGVDWRFQAGCVLHESLHATFTNFTVDEYSGWHGVSSSTATYPGTGTDPLLNADSYTTLVMDLS